MTKTIRAIFYRNSLKEFENFCDKNDIEYQEWSRETNLGWEIEYRVDLYNLDEEQIQELITYFDSDEFLKYSYLIIWE